MIHRPKFVSCKWESSFGELLEGAHRTLSCATVSMIVIALNDRFRDPQEVSIDSPVYVCQQFG